MSELDPVVLRIADEELFVGHVLTSRAGWGPELELNLAMSSIGQDEIGHARLLYGVVAGDDPAAVNALVYDRPVEQFHACALSTVDSQDWATLVVKHWLYELAEVERLRLLVGCDVPALADAAERMRHEEVFHHDFWTTWFVRTLDSVDGLARLQAALDALWTSAAELLDLPGFAPTAVAGAASRWRQNVERTCAEHGLELRAGVALPSRAGDLLADMRSVYVSAPGQW